MKSSISVALWAVICIASVRSKDVCLHNVQLACQSSPANSDSNGVCNARYGGIDKIQPEVQAHINFHLSKSYEYLLMATNFNSYQKHRPGFAKLFSSLSDRSFDDTINLIKQVTRRGGKVDFNSKHESADIFFKQIFPMEIDELRALSVALDKEKQLANHAIYVNTQAVHTAKRDPEIAEYLEENFLTSQAESIRELSGYVNDLSKIMNSPDPSFGVYLFDEYLQKQ